MFSIDPVLEQLGHAIDLAALRHSVHAANIANADAEGYTRLEVALEAATARGGAAASEPRVVATPGEAVRLDAEMADMAQNAVRYQSLLTALEKSMSLLRYAARDGREG